MVDWFNAPKEQDPWYATALQDVLGGYKASQEPARMKLADELARAKMEKERRFGGLTNLSGVAREAASLDILRQLYGENSPVYQNAEKAYKQDIERTRLLNAYNTFLMNHPERYLTSTGKSFVEQSNVATGNLMGVNRPLTPEESTTISNEYERRRYKEGTPEFLQRQNEASKQIDETIALIDPNKAFSYSGVKGQAELWKDRYNAQRTGEIPQRLKDYEEMETYLHNLREQIRSYLGASITAGMTKDLDYLIDPSNWMNHPEIAKKKYEAVIRAYENEKKVTEKAVKHGNPSAPPLTFPIQNKKTNPEGNEVAQSRFKNDANRLGLNPSPTNVKQAVSRENIIKTAKEKKWGNEKLQAALRYYGYAI